MPTIKFFNNLQPLTLYYSAKSRFLANSPARNNSFDSIRLLAAFLVVFSHSFALTGHEEPELGSVKLGTFGIWIFFIISGFMISASWKQYPRLNVFLAKRLLRIFPGLLVMLVLTIIICGLFFSTSKSVSYFTDQLTLNYLNNALLYPVVFTLPGVFTHNTISTVNGSIWSLSYEFTMYIAVALLGIKKLFKREALAVIWGALFSINIFLALPGIETPHFSLFFLAFDQFVILSFLFFSGVIVQHRIPLDKFSIKYGLLSLVAFCLLSVMLPQLTLIFASTLLTYSIFAIGNNGFLSWLQNIGDASYGIYIYSYPIQQMIISITNTPSAIKLFLASAPLSALIGLISWYVVEKRALKMKDKIDTARYPVFQADSSW